jgi:hypothetical protein
MKKKQFSLSPNGLLYRLVLNKYITNQYPMKIYGTFNYFYEIYNLER